MDPVQEAVEYSTMRCPKDVIRMIDVIATLDHKSIQDWSNTTLREFVTAKFNARVKGEPDDESDTDLHNPELGEAGA